MTTSAHFYSLPRVWRGTEAWCSNPSPSDKEVKEEEQLSEAGKQAPFLFKHNGWLLNALRPDDLMINSFI